VTCSISFDGGITFNTSVACTINSTISRIIGTYSLANQINAGISIVYKIMGVESPPTAQTAVSSSFLIETADGSGNLIDSFSSCTINPVCVTSLTNGLINSSALNINSQYNSPQIYFTSYPVITVLGSDVVQVYYSPISDLSGCNTLRFWRADSDITSMTTPAFTTYYTFIISPAMPAN